MAKKMGKSDTITGASFLARLLAIGGLTARVAISHGSATVTIPGFKRAADKGGDVIEVSDSFDLAGDIDPERAAVVEEAAQNRGDFVRELRAALEADGADTKAVAAEFGLHVAPAFLLAYPKGEGKPVSPEEKARKANKKEAKSEGVQTAAIRAMAASGLKPEIIAAMLNKPIGEVQAILSATSSTL